MMMQGANSNTDMLLNTMTGIVITISFLTFGAIAHRLYTLGRYLMSILFSIALLVLIVISIIASNLQLLNSQSKTEYIAATHSSAYQALLKMQENYSSQIKELKSHPYYNNENPVNKKQIDQKISVLIKLETEVNRQIVDFNPAISSTGSGFRIMGEWLGLTAERFKQYVFMTISIMLDVISALCSVFLSIFSNVGNITRNSGNPTPRTRKGLLRRLFSSFKLPSIPSIPNGARALSMPQKNIGTSSKNIPEYSLKYSKKDLGKNLTFKLDNNDMVANLEDFPHVIIAGITGSGKSNFTRWLLLQLLEKNTPKQLQLVIMDLKGSEFFMYESLPHLMKPIISSTRCPDYKEKAIEYLSFLEEEVTRRQGILYDSGCRDYQGYVSKNKTLQYSYLVVIIEEISIISTEKAVQERLRKLASLSRSAGVSIILTTQYPYARVISTDITGNCAAKFCFKVETTSQSITVIGSKGAEILKGKGHGIFSNDGVKTQFIAPVVDEKYEKAVIGKYGSGVSMPLNVIPFPKNIPVPKNIPDSTESNENIPKNELAKKWYGEGMKQVDIAKKLGVPQGTVSKLLSKMR